MAEGIVGGILAEDEQQSEAQAVAGAEAFAAAVAARLSGNDPGVARKTEAFLEKQAQLLDTQRQHLEDEHALRLSQLRGQRVAQTLRIGFQVVIALLIIVIGAGVGLMLRDAFTSHNVVVDAFDAPAALAARGVTGKVVAGDVLDELTRLQNATAGGPASAFRRSLSNAWSNQVTVEVPETGISLEELSQMLRARLGHDVHIGGALVQTDSGGLALTVRGDGLEAKAFMGDADSLRQLTAQAAQYLYAQSEPSLWAAYLLQTGRCQEALTFIRSAYDSADPQYRPTLLYDEALCLRDTGGPLSEIMALLDQARALDPDFSVDSYLSQEGILVQFGDEERAWRIGQKLGQLTAREPPLLRAFHQIESYELTRDYSALRGLMVAILQLRGPSGFPKSAAQLNLASIDVALHDPDAAVVALQNAPQSTPQDGREANEIRALVAEERGDSLTAAQQAQAAWAAIVDPFGHNSLAPDFEGATRGCVLAPIEEAAGHPESADAMLALPGAAQLTDCQRFRGDILDRRGDWAGAQQAYAKAVALAPDLPAGYYSWGVALARHGDLSGALTKLQAANQRGPHWADPLKAWGDVLAKQSHWSDAVAKYDEALKYAPHWAALRQARDAVSSNQR